MYVGGWFERKFNMEFRTALRSLPEQVVKLLDNSVKGEVK